jgi:ATP-binding cassette subfamily C (CFTR/MRP) protein 1
MDMKEPSLSRESSASSCSRWFICWYSKLLYLGGKRVLEDSDLGDLREGDDSLTSYNKLMALWGAEVKKNGIKKASLMTVWWQMIGTLDLIKIIGWSLIDFIFLVITPVLSQQIIRHVEGTINLAFSEMLIYAIILSLAPMTSGFCRSQSILLAKRKSLHLYAALTTAVYRKTMRLSAAGRATVETGHIINMISSDANNSMQRAVVSLCPLFMAPPVIIIVLTLLYGIIGNSMFAGFIFLLISLPINFVIFRNVVGWHRQIVYRADTRIKRFNELVTGIRIVKYYSWELPFNALIDAARKYELGAISKHAVWMQCGMMVIFMQMPNLMQLVTFTTFSLNGGFFSASNIFTAMQLFNILRGPISQFPSSLSQLASLIVAMKRLGSYLKREEQQTNDGDVFTNKSPENNNEATVEIINGSFEWVRATENKENNKNEQENETKQSDMKLDVVAELDERGKIEEMEKDQETFVLDNINIKCMKGDLVMVVGLVGSGKSSLLCALLNEMPKMKGSISVKGKTSLVSQNAWITNNTLRSNITFGEEFDKKRYNQILKACSLEQDIETFEGGDQIMIGERGINLSGGQKTRAGLARACYAKSNIILLDCPLAAVDSHVADHIFKHCIINFLKNRTRIYATNQIQRLKFADKIIILRDGSMVAEGTYDEITKNYGSELEKLGQEKQEQQDQQLDTNNECGNVRTRSTSSGGLSASSRQQRSLSASSGSSDTAKLRSSSTGSIGGADKPSQTSSSLGTNKAAALIQDEERAIGHVSIDVWKYFFRSGGWCFAISAISFLTFFTYVQVGTSFVLASWSNDVVSRPTMNSSAIRKEELMLLTYQEHDRLWLGLYGGTMAFSLVVMLFGGYLMAMLRVRVATTLHKDMMVSILRAPIAFFDVTPAGRIMNRFSKDQNQVDMMLTVMIGFLFVTANTTIAALLAMTIATFGLFAVLFVPLSYMFYKLSGWIRHSAIEIQRLEANHSSPLYAASTEILGGVNTIRAFDQIERFEETFRQRLDRQMVPYFLGRSVLFAWMMMRINLISSFTVCVLMIVVLCYPGLLPPGNLALALTFGLSVTDMMMHIVNLSIEAEIQMNAVERIKYYAKELPKEKPMNIEETAPDSSWPTNGVISFEKVVAGYRDGPDVLKSISFDIKSSEKVGIVGRTGSGKSSLLVLLFRIIEPRSGKVTIDGIDTSTLGLRQLRKNLGIIPQTPVMFSGTLRKNIDPFEKYTDAQLWDVLEKVSLKDTVENLKGGEKGNVKEKLEFIVTEGGTNFSVGQRQLLCMARALLLDPKILLLDEVKFST